MPFVLQLRQERDVYSTASERNDQLRRSDMFQTMDWSTSQYIPLLQSLRNILFASYKHFVPTGLH